MKKLDNEEIGRASRLWLQEYQRTKLPELRRLQYGESKYRNEVTLIAYTFPCEAADFDYIEFSVLYSWKLLGRLKAVIVADRMTPQLERFRERNVGWTDVQVEPKLKCGSITSMSIDCVQRLYRRFSTPYCLIIQDDGFPIRDNLGEFLGKWDYLGAPTVRDVPAQKLLDWFRHFGALNGGLSLRSRRICEAAAKEWRGIFSRFLREDSPHAIEDVFYTITACKNPLYRFRHKFPSCREARKFAVLDFNGALDLKSLRQMPFGIHGASTARQWFEMHNLSGESYA